MKSLFSDLFQDHVVVVHDIYTENVYFDWQS